MLATYTKVFVHTFAQCINYFWCKVPLLGRNAYNGACRRPTSAQNLLRWRLLVHDLLHECQQLLLLPWLHIHAIEKCSSLALISGYLRLLQWWLTHWWELRLLHWWLIHWWRIGRCSKRRWMRVDHWLRWLWWLPWLLSNAWRSHQGLELLRLLPWWLIHLWGDKWCSRRCRRQEGRLLPLLLLLLQPCLLLLQRTRCLERMLLHLLLLHGLHGLHHLHHHGSCGRFDRSRRSRSRDHGCNSRFRSMRHNYCWRRRRCSWRSCRRRRCEKVTDLLDLVEEVLLRLWLREQLQALIASFLLALQLSCLDLLRQGV